MILYLKMMLFVGIISFLVASYNIYLKPSDDSGFVTFLAVTTTLLWPVVIPLIVIFSIGYFIHKYLVKNVWPNLIIQWKKKDEEYE